MSQSSVISGLQMWMGAPKREHNTCDPVAAATPTVIAEEHRGMQEAAICHSCHPLQWTVTFFVAQSCPTLCNSTDFSMPGSYVHGILQARIAIPFSGGSSQPRDETWLSCIAGRFFTIWATREAHKQSRNRIWPQITEMPMKGMNLVSPEACIFPYIFLKQWLSLVLLFVIPWTAASQTSLSFTISQNLLKLMSIESVMPSKHLVLSSPSPPVFNLSQHQGLF